MSFDLSLPEELPPNAIHLLQYIRKLKLSPNDVLPSERELIEELEISRSKLRESLYILQLWGIVEKRPRFGTVLKEPDPHLVAPLLEFHLDRAVQGGDEIRDARAILESAIAFHAAGTRTRADVLRMELAIEAQVASIGDRNAWILADRQFHETVIASCHNLLISVVGAAIVACFASIKPPPVICEGGPVSEKIIEEHREIMAFISSGDGESARSAMQLHIQTPVEVRLGAAAAPPPRRSTL